MSCFFREFAPEGYRQCDGPIDLHHVLKRQTIRRLFPQLPMYATDDEVAGRKLRLKRALDDRRNLVSVCRRHHDLFERAKLIEVPRDGLPEQVETFAAEYGLEFELERQFGPLGGDPSIPERRSA